MKIKVHNARSDGYQSKSKVKVNTNQWIPPSHHICPTFNTLTHIGDGTRRSPLLCCHRKGQIGAWKQKGCDWPPLKGNGGGKVRAWMSGMLPDTG